MTNLESIAKAIYERRNGHGCKAWAHLPKAHQEPYLGDARAAVEAMREPSDVACRAGGRKAEAMMFKGDPDGTGDISVDMGHVFTAMIDAILNEEKP